ncbi:MAG: zinc dependent phospholipase C family protein [Candidatus Omnitrophota bacterium]
MPKYGVHHIVLKEAVPELYASGNSAASSAADAIQAQMSSAIIGSIGPDLFFWGPDYEIVDKLYKLYSNIEEVVKVYNKVVRPIREIINAVEEPLENAVETLAPNTVELIRHLLNEVKETSELFKSAVGAGLFAGVLEGANLLTNAAGISSLSYNFFQLFVPDLQKNKNEKDWYWFDMLHYRRTGDFARNLVEGAGSAREKAFALGYLSHVATDVTGHSYVNQIVGTPYRLNVHRHVTVENFQDTWKYAGYYNGESINHTLFSRLGLPENLPSDVGDLLYGTFKKTYNNFDHPTRLPGGGFYTRGQIDVTYEVFYKVLKLMGSMAVERPEEPFSGAADILANALSNFSLPPSPPSSSSSMCSWEDVLSFGLTSSSRECYEEFFEEVANWLNYLGELLVWSLETLRNLIDLLLTLLLSLPISVLLAILYGIQLLCYQIYRSARMVLSTNGFVMPEPDELDNSIARNLITLAQPCAYNFKIFPSRGTPVTNNLVCPVPIAEEPVTAAGFHSAVIESTPERFISEEPFNEQALYRYAVSANSPNQTRSLQRDRLSIGNAIHFTAWMIQHANESGLSEDIKKALYADWNLDADRGYGYRAWRGNIPNDEPFIVESEEYL